MTQNVTACQARKRKKIQRRVKQHESFLSIDVLSSLNILVDKLSRSAKFRDIKRRVFLKMFNKLIALSRNFKQLYFSEEWLAKKCGGHWVTMSRLLNDLADMGFIYIQARPIKNNKRQTNIYYLNEVLNDRNVQKRLIDFVPAFRCFALKALFSFGLGIVASGPLIRLHTTNVKQLERCKFLFTGLKVGRGVPETVYVTEGVSTSGVQAHGVDRKVPRTGLTSLSSSIQRIFTPQESQTMDEINRLKQRHLQMQEEQSTKGKYKISWWNPNDPFKATNKVLSEHGNGPLPTIDKLEKMTIKDHLAQELAHIEVEKIQKKAKEDNERVSQTDVPTHSVQQFIDESPFFDYSGYEAIEDESPWET